MPAVLETPADVTRFFGDLASAVAQPKMREPLQQWADETQESLGETFEREQDPEGNPWPKWNFRSLSVNPAGKKTLQSSGLLLASIVQDIAEHVERVTDTSAEMGTSVPYAGNHQEGGPSVTTEPLISRDGRIMLPAGTTINVPQRQFMGITQQSADRAEELIGDYIERRLETI